MTFPVPSVCGVAFSSLSSPISVTSWKKGKRVFPPRCPQILSNTGNVPPKKPYHPLPNLQPARCMRGISNFPLFILRATTHSLLGFLLDFQLLLLLLRWKAQFLKGFRGKNDDCVCVSLSGTLCSMWCPFFRAVLCQDERH